MLAFSLTNPVISRPNLLSELDQYGSLSNLKMNVSKLEAIGVSMSTSQIEPLKMNFNFRWTTSALKYLGMYMPPRLNQTYALNFPNFLSKSTDLAV